MDLLREIPGREALKLRADVSFKYLSLFDLFLPLSFSEKKKLKYLS